MSHQGKWEYVRAIHERYRKADRQTKGVILNEFCLNTGYHRKYAIRLLHGSPPERGQRRRRRQRGYSYGPQVVSLLAAVWEAAGYPWSVRLKALLPLWMPWMRRRFRVPEQVERELLRISPRQIDRRLQGKKRQLRKRIYGRTQPGRLLKHQVAVQTHHWDVKVPGFTEVDLVAHSGNSGSGEFAYSLNVTDIQTTWTETRAILGKSQEAVVDAFEEIRPALPFRLFGIDSDNGSEFLNWHLGRWCARHEVQFTRGRPYQKEDNAHVEQKNWTHVRKLLGWNRYDSPQAVEAINDLYRNELRLWLNLYLPSVKLIRKQRVGSKLRRVYDAARTPLERVLDSGLGDPAQLASLQARTKTLDPFVLAQAIDQKLHRIEALANRRLSPQQTQGGSVTFSMTRQPNPGLHS